MELILIKSYRGLGQIGKVVKVKRGFGSNFLIPNRIAIRATEDNIKILESEQSKYKAQDAEDRSNALSIAKEIEGLYLTFIRQSSSDGRLFGSVSNKEIAKELNNRSSIDIPHALIAIEQPIKTLGVFAVNILLHAEVTAKINILVVRTESEAADILSTIGNKQDDGDQETE